jgi:putative FmdB family regulatory protein
MPRYVYRCTECEELSTISHLSEEVHYDCPRCSKPNSLIKLLTRFTTSNTKPQSRKKTGIVTEEFIQDAREDLEQQKDALGKYDE